MRSEAEALVRPKKMRIFFASRIVSALEALETMPDAPDKPIGRTDHDPSLDDLNAAHRRFLALVDDLRPELHAYCARMTGSIFEAEDVVQDTLMAAYYELSMLRELPALRPWLFRIAYHRTIDQLRRRQRRAADVALDTVDASDEALPDTDQLPADVALERADALRVAFDRFGSLPPLQRSCVILKDVLGHSLDEIAALLDTSVQAVKAALHRGRARLQSAREAPRRPPPASASPALAAYARLFDARDWDGVRAMLRDDVKLDLVARVRRQGRDVGVYFGKYDGMSDPWRARLVWVEGRELLGLWRDPAAARPSSLIEVELRDGQVAFIRDYYFAPYVLGDAPLHVLSP